MIYCPSEYQIRKVYRCENHNNCIRVYKKAIAISMAKRNGKILNSPWFKSLTEHIRNPNYQQLFDKLTS